MGIDLNWEDERGGLLGGVDDPHNLAYQLTAERSALAMHRLILLIVIGLALSTVGQASELVPAERTAIFPATKAAKLIRAVCHAPPSFDGYWTPTQRDLEGVEEQLFGYLKSQHSGGTRDWAIFRKQVAGIKRGDDELLFIYYFPFARRTEEDPDAWKLVPYVVDDGGDCFFRVIYDLKSRRFVWFECNANG